MRRLLFAVPVLSLSLLAASEDPVPDFAPPGTCAILGLHLRNVIDSPLVRSLAKEMSPAAGAMWTAVSPFPGVDLRKDVDEIVVASALEGSPPPVLIVLRGRFPAEEFEKGAQRYLDVPIRLNPDGTALALFDPATLVAGDLRGVRAAIDRRGAHAAPLDPDLLRRAGRLSARYAVWGAGDLPKGFHPPPGPLEGLASMDRFDFGIALSQGLELSATLHLAAAADVQKLASALALLEALSKAQPASSGAKVETRIDNGTFTISLMLPQPVVEKALAQTLAGNLSPIRPPVVAPPPRIVTDDHGNTVLLTLPGKE